MRDRHSALPRQHLAELHQLAVERRVEGLAKNELERPGRGLGGGRRFTLSHAAVTKFVACVNQHGYKLPTPNFSGKGPIFPVSIEKNAKFQKAARACQADLRPAGATIRERHHKRRMILEVRSG